MNKHQQLAESPVAASAPRLADERSGGFLSLKVPPPAYLLLAGGLIHLARPGRRPRPRWRWLGLPLLALGLGLDVYALREFRRHRTTVNPLHPEKASHLVRQGAYRYTRNPMYLGMALILSGWSLLRTSPIGLAVVPAFMGILTKVQIMPEEQQLARSFGEPYRIYLKQVRRWL